MSASICMSSHSPGLFLSHSAIFTRGEDRSVRPPSQPNRTPPYTIARPSTLCPPPSTIQETTNLMTRHALIVPIIPLSDIVRDLHFRLAPDAVFRFVLRVGGGGSVMPRHPFSAPNVQ